MPGGKPGYCRADSVQYYRGWGWIGVDPVEIFGGLRTQRVEQTEWTSLVLQAKS
jgi:hypothetical protein